MQETWQEPWVQSLGGEDPLKKEMATHPSLLAWRIPWTEEPGGLQSMGSRKSWMWLSDWAHSRIRQEVLTCCLPRSCLMGWAEPGTCWRLFPAAAAWTISQFPHLSSGNSDCPYLTWVLCARHNVFSAGFVIWKIWFFLMITSLLSQWFYQWFSSGFQGLPVVLLAHGVFCSCKDLGLIPVLLN